MSFPVLRNRQSSTIAQKHRAAQSYLPVCFLRANCLSSFQPDYPRSHLRRGQLSKRPMAMGVESSSLTEVASLEGKMYSEELIMRAKDSG